MNSQVRGYLFIFAIGVLGSFIYWQTSQEPLPRSGIKVPTKPSLTTKQLDVSQTQIVKHSPLPMPKINDSMQEWNNWLHKQSEQIGQLTESPDLAQKQMQKYADAIPKEKLEWLKDRAKNTNINADERLLAIEYLSLNSLTESLDQLEDIVLSPIDSQLSTPLKNEILLLKAAAIEGFSKKENFKSKAIAKLNYINQNTDEQFLIDRTQRSLWHLKGKAQSPEEQDTEALKALLETE